MVKRGRGSVMNWPMMAMHPESHHRNRNSLDCFSFWYFLRDHLQSPDRMVMNSVNTERRMASWVRKPEPINWERPKSVLLHAVVVEELVVKLSMR